MSLLKRLLASCWETSFLRRAELLTWSNLLSVRKQVQLFRVGQAYLRLLYDSTQSIMQCTLQRQLLACSRNKCSRFYSVMRTPDMEVDNLVIGGGVVGLAIAERLARTRSTETTILVERNGRIGEETRYIWSRKTMLLQITKPNTACIRLSPVPGTARSSMQDSTTPNPAWRHACASKARTCCTICFKPQISPTRRLANGW